MTHAVVYSGTHGHEAEVSASGPYDTYDLATEALAKYLESQGHDLDAPQGGGLEPLREQVKGGYVDLDEGVWFVTELTPLG